jgi:sec-independent protein translocase protein TatA
MVGFIPGLGLPEMLALLVVGVLLFGRKLPDIGRSLGKTVIEFKKGINGMEDEISSATSGSPRPAIEPEAVKPPQRVTPSAPVFSDAPAAATNLPPKV